MNRRSFITVHDLEPLPKLQKVHLSWPFQLDPSNKSIPMWLSVNRPFLKEYVRITGSIPLSLEWYTLDQLHVVHSFGAPICLSSSPYRRMREAKLPPESEGQEYRDDLADFGTRIGALRKYPVQYLIVDIEQWRDTRMDESALLRKYEAISQIGKTTFPQAKQIFYERGAYEPNGSADDGWAPVTYYPPGSPGDFHSCSLYFCEWALDQQVYQNTVAHANGVPVIPFISLGGCQNRKGPGWGPFEAGGFTLDTAWQMGGEINHPWSARFPKRFPVSAAPLVCFWPAAFSPRFPEWGNQFVAYCKGAANLKLDDKAS